MITRKKKIWTKSWSWITHSFETRPSHRPGQVIGSRVRWVNPGWPGSTQKKNIQRLINNLINNRIHKFDQQFNKGAGSTKIKSPLYWKPVIHTFLTKLKIRPKKNVQRFFKSSKPPTLSVTCADMINFFNEESYNVMDFLLAISSRKRKKLQNRNEILWTATIHVIWTPTRILEKKRRTKTLRKQSASMYPWVFS